MVSRRSRSSACVRLRRDGLFVGGIVRSTASGKRNSSARGSSTKPRKVAAPDRHFAVCVDNSSYEVSLERNKIYVILPDRDAERDGDLRLFKTEVIQRQGFWRHLEAVEFAMLDWLTGLVTAACSSRLAMSHRRNTRRGTMLKRRWLHRCLDFNPPTSRPPTPTAARAGGLTNYRIVCDSERFPTDDSH
jgi:hypothetical protein